MRLLTFLLLFTLAFSCHSYGQVSDINQAKLSVENLIGSQSNSYLDQSNQEFYNPWTVHKRISGIGLAMSMAATLVGSLAMNDEGFATTVIPVVGPFISITRVESDPNLYYRPGGKSLLLASGITQSTLLIYYVISIIGEDNYRGRYMNKTIMVSPLVKGGWYFNDCQFLKIRYSIGHSLQ